MPIAMIIFRGSPANRTIVRMALPTILMNVSVPLLGAVDTAVMGHLPDVRYLGAVSLGSLVFTTFFWGFAFFRMSTVGLTAQTHGQGDAREAAHVLGRGLLLSLAAGLAVALLREPIGWAAFRLLNASPEVERLGREFFGIVALAMPAALLLQVFQGWFYGIKRVGFPVVLTIFVNAANIVLSLALVLGFGLASKGVAYATFSAQYLGLLLTLAVFFRRHAGYWRLLSPRALVDGARLREILALNGDIFLRTLCLLFANAYFMSQTAALGDAILAANSILLQFRGIAVYALDGFATAAEVAVGSALGGGRRAELLEAISLSQQWGLAVGGAISLLYLGLAPWLPHLFTANPDVLALVFTFYVWIVLEPWISNVCFILDGVFIGATATRSMRNSMILAVCIVYLPAIFVLGRLFGNHGMWAAYLLLYFARSATLYWHVRRLRIVPGYALR
jgi:MATE family multidrug resistance protein